MDLAAGGLILLAGTWGRAGDARYIGRELVSHPDFDRAALTVLALTASSFVLTAMGINLVFVGDHGFVI